MNFIRNLCQNSLRIFFKYIYEKCSKYYFRKTSTEIFTIIYSEIPSMILSGVLSWILHGFFNEIFLKISPEFPLGAPLKELSSTSPRILTEIFSNILPGIHTNSSKKHIRCYFCKYNHWRIPLRPIRINFFEIFSKNCFLNLFKYSSRNSLKIAFSLDFLTGFIQGFLQTFLRRFLLELRHEYFRFF